nr:ribonuclease H-like domain-containing protein [Tanacetum cinerariifolium]
MGMKGKAIKPSAGWSWKPSQNLSNKGPKNNSVLVMFKKYTYIDTQGRLKHMTGNISYLSYFEPFDGGYVSFGKGGCKITGKGTIKTGKFEPKGDEAYFLGYSMSSKAFRVFNKRTKRVEENMHIEFLENKAIEKGSGLNWLFDIDSLTKSMNYVPVVDAGTNSTNFSGTKIDARKDVKKDVSSLRYIVLPNWVHEEHLESISSQPQDPSNTDAPESSGNSNPTATLTNPLGYQVETLIVETPIPTISLPVLTVCFTDSQEPSSETRLISKRVTNQAETPSLDNILTLTNQFKDTLRVTINSEESNGVEADVSNMEASHCIHSFKIHCNPSASKVHSSFVVSHIITLQRLLSVLIILEDPNQRSPQLVSEPRGSRSRIYK